MVGFALGSHDISCRGNKGTSGVAGWVSHVFADQNEAVGQPLERALFLAARRLNATDSTSSNNNIAYRCTSSSVATFGPLAVDPTRNAENSHVEQL